MISDELSKVLPVICVAAKTFDTNQINLTRSYSLVAQQQFVDWLQELRSPSVFLTSDSALPSGKRHMELNYQVEYEGGRVCRPHH